ncbi:MAG: hypothetical protein QM731_08625 [Chitinophagaceae bacterium]
MKFYTKLIEIVYNSSSISDISNKIMSYDIYCYQSHLGKPDLEEALAAIEIIDEENRSATDPTIKVAIAKALKDYNPRLEQFEFDYEQIARLQGINIEEAKKNFNHIELNTPEGDLATQITVFDNNVSINIPYWYTGEQSEKVFKQVAAYTKIIRQTAGYFVYDPQTESAYDPLER